MSFMQRSVHQLESACQKCYAVTFFTGKQKNITPIDLATSSLDGWHIGTKLSI